MAQTLLWMKLLNREAEDADSDEPEAGQQEIFASWSLLILIVLLILALITSYVLQTRKVQAVHETVVSIFAGMLVGLVLRLTAVDSVLGAVSFDYQFFFNLLLPPIILASGYELHQGNFFRNIGTILTFAFAGTVISAMVLGILLFLWTRLPLFSWNISFLEAMSVGATLSATDPVTILAIFNTYKVDPKLYTVIFGESVLNDAIAIVLFETAQKYRQGMGGNHVTVFSLLESIGVFLLVFFGSLLIGIVVGVATSLFLKFTHVRRFPKIESCLILLIAYASYFFSNAIHMSGIVSLLFCGICMKHYAYHNMSRRTQLTTKFVFQVMAQLSENFIFIYLGLSLFTEDSLEYKPIFIFVTVIGICIARWCAVFPLSYAINWFIRLRARRSGREAMEELPYSYQVMLFWAGLRGAVGVALAAGLTGPNGNMLRTTVLVVVVLTVIIFGGTTARMLEIMGIQTGVIEELDSDDEFDIEVIAQDRSNLESDSSYGYKRSQRFGSNVPPPNRPNSGLALSGANQDSPRTKTNLRASSLSDTFERNGHSPNITGMQSRIARYTRAQDIEESGLVSGESGNGDDDLGLPPARRTAFPYSSRNFERPSYASATALNSNSVSSRPNSGGASSGQNNGGHLSPTEQSKVTSATGAISQLFTGLSDPAGAFKQIDEGYIKPKLLLEPKNGMKGGSS